jgi:selenocysteine-specific elongation factor
VRASQLRRLGVVPEPLPADAVQVAGWLVSGRQLTIWRQALLDALSNLPHGMSPDEAARTTGLPDPALLPAVATEPIVMRGGRILLERPLPERLRPALDALRRDLTDAPFRAPAAERLRELGLDRAAVALLAREGHLLTLGEGVVLLPGADDVARDVLARLPQPFTTSRARQALDTSRRVVLPLLAHLDRTGRTVRLPDDSRRVRGAG